MAIESSLDSDVTQLLRQVTKGEEGAEVRLIAVVYDELRRLARSYMRRENEYHTLQPTALVHEVYLRLVQQRSVDWKGRSHFFAIAAQMMRRVLVDHARARLRGKRGAGNRPIPLDEVFVFAPERSLELVMLDQSLERLAQIDDRQCKVVELRFFGGLSVEETSEALGVSPKTVKRDWSMAKAWLHGDLKTSHAGPLG